jgi:hypothetical protein
MEGLETTGLGDEPQPADDTSDVDDMAAQAAAAFGGVGAGEPEAGDEDVAAHGTVEMEATEDESDDGVAEPKADAEEADDGVADDGMAELAALANAFDAGADERSDGGEADDEAVGADADQLHDILDDWAADGADATDEDEDVAEVQLMDFDTSDGESAESSSARGESMGDDWLTELTVDRRAGREEAAEQGEPADELLPSVALDVAPAPGKVEEAQYEDDLFEDDLDTAGASEAQELTVASAPAVEEDSSVAPEAPSAEPAPADDFVDLGSLVFDDAETEKTTRWFVEMADPTGDDEADFAQMLTQFKAKVAEHLEADDVRAHYDLGTAYREMGLVDEAIAEFQQALRGSGHHLPTHELLGQCFMEKGQYEVAIRSMTKAIESPFEVEDELLGIYYYLGRAHEELGNRAPATEFYEKIFALDINFRDVTERLRALR